MARFERRSNVRLDIKGLIRESNRMQRKGMYHDRMALEENLAQRLRRILNAAGKYASWKLASITSNERCVANTKIKELAEKQLLSVIELCRMKRNVHTI